MRIFLFIFLLSAIGEDAIAQKKLLIQPYHTNLKKASIANFLQDINKQSGIVLEYSSASIDGNKIVQLNGNENTIGNVLQTILRGQYVKLMEHNNKIIIVPSKEIFSISNYLPAQYSFYGYVKETETSEPLVSAAIYEPATRRGVVSNNQGYFNFFLSEGKHLVVISYSGFEPQTILLDIRDNQRKDISLSLKKDSLVVVTVQSETPVKDGSIVLLDDNNSSTMLMNEDDPLQYLYMSPGLQNASYSFSGFQVRGGGTDENLFLLDGNLVYNTTHMLGAISILNPTVIKSMRFYKSDFPARLGGSLSSVLDVYTKQGNMKNWEGEIHAGLLAAAVTLEGPLVKDKVAIMVSGRKNIPLPFYESLQDGVTSNFYDAQLRLSAIVNDNNKLALNFYTGGDQLRQTGSYVNNLHKWGNTLGSITWNYLLGNKSYLNTSINYSRYQNLTSSQYSVFETDEDEEMGEEGDEELDIETMFLGTYSFIKNYNAKSEAEIYISRKLKINTGLRFGQTTIKPLEAKITELEDDDEEGFISFEPLQYEDLSMYAEPEIKVGNNFFVKPGIRASAYWLEDYHTIAFQPRLYAAYRINNFFKLFASYSKMNQFLHLVLNPYAGANRDQWLPSTENVLPESSEIYNAGFIYKPNKEWSILMDAYYKRLLNVTNYAEGKSTFINSENWEQSIELGKGRSYGAEFTIKKSGDKFFLQSSYALSWSWRQFAGINNGEEFPYKYDHRHAANIGMMYTISPRLDISGLWSFASGNIYTQDGIVFTDSLQAAPNGDELINAYQFTYSYSPNNQYRAKSYQRYDLSITYHSLKGKKLFSSLKVGMYNINGAEDQYAYIACVDL